MEERNKANIFSIGYLMIELENLAQRTNNSDTSINNISYLTHVFPLPAKGLTLMALP
jgi:hypothetical protein